MVLTLANHTLEGPFFYLSDLKNERGIYVIVDQHDNGEWYPLDVDESAVVRTSVIQHARHKCWQEHSRVGLGYAVLYLPGSSSEERRARAEMIRQSCGPLPCDR